MRFNSRNLALIAVAAAAIAPASAAARPDLGPIPRDGSMTCGKDYSRNSVTGDYCVSTKSVSPAHFALPATPRTEPVVTTDDSGFSWSDAGAGAGGVLAVVALTAGGVIVLRRRHGSSSADQRRSPATG